ncbi:hypothetical protein BAE44_0004163 [Dichanthelium oligosanthes]|uniref:Uncharacterized protein n=1 Tax=Dichanthelium oligosanthes TaxID=888268 RepID=A0A1E5WBP7_9POAL|nr:hypothetical protein BAE44_0004163 [Dichanthelium oligosanthes]
MLHLTDNDDFVIPSLSVEESDLGDWEASRASNPQPPPKPTKDTESIYLGPHGAPPSRAKKPEDTSAATTGYRDKNNRGREADQKAFGSSRNSKGGNSGDFHRHNGANHAKDPFKRAA